MLHEEIKLNENEEAFSLAELAVGCNVRII